MLGNLNAKIRGVMGDGLTRRMAGGALAALIIKTASAGLAFLMFVGLARAMTGLEYGRFAFAFSLALFLALAATLGQPKLVLRFLSRYLAANDSRNARGVVDFTLRRSLVTASVTASASVGCLAALHFTGLSASTGIGIAISAGLLVLAFALAEYYAHSLRALGEVTVALAPRDLAWRGAIVAMAGVAILSDVRLPAEPVLWFCAVTLALAVAVQGGVFHRKMRNTLPEPAEETRDPAQDDAPEWKQATPGLALLAVMGEAFQHLFVVATGITLAAIEAGQFFAAAKTAALLSLPLVATNMITAPMISRHYHANETRKLQDLCRMSIGLAAPLTCAGLAVVLVFGRYILGLFGPGFGIAFPALLIVSAGQLVNALCGPTGFLMMMTGHERRFLAFLTASNVAGLAALVVLAPGFGIVGAAIGVTVAQCGWNIAVWAWARRTLRVDPTALSLVRRSLPSPAPRRRE